MELDWLCQQLRSKWDEVNPGLCARIDRAYQFAKIGDSRNLRYLLSALYLIVAETKARHIIQTGTFVGHSTLAIAFSLEDNDGEGILETIDPEPTRYGAGIIPNPVTYAKSAISYCGLSNRVVFHRGYSVRAWDSGRMSLPKVPEGILPELAKHRRTDLLVLDGDHTFDGVFWDLEFGHRSLASDRTRLIFIHDYQSIPEVRKAVRAWLKYNRNECDYRVCSQPTDFAIIQCHRSLLQRKQRVGF